MKLPFPIIYKGVIFPLICLSPDAKTTCLTIRERFVSPCGLFGEIVVLETGITRLKGDVGLEGL